jgi:hypothetical protein
VVKRDTQNTLEISVNPKAIITHLHALPREIADTIAKEIKKEIATTQANKYGCMEIIHAIGCIVHFSMAIPYR